MTAPPSILHGVVAYAHYSERASGKPREVCRQTGSNRLSPRKRCGSTGRRNTCAEFTGWSLEIHGAEIPAVGRFKNLPENLARVDWLVRVEVSRKLVREPVVNSGPKRG